MSIRQGPDPKLSHSISRYTRALDRICEAPMTPEEEQRLAELRQIARTTGVGGDDRKVYSLLTLVEARQKEKARGVA